MADDNSRVLTIANQNFSGSYTLDEAVIPRLTDHIDRVDFINCNMEGLKRILIDFYEGQKTFTDCNFDSTEIERLGDYSFFNNCTFQEATIEYLGDDFDSEVMMRDCNFTHATFDNVYFNRGNFIDCTFNGAHLTQSTWYAPHLFTNMDLRGATLHNVAFDNVPLIAEQQLEQDFTRTPLKGVSTINTRGYWQKGDHLYSASTLDHHELTTNWDDIEPGMDGNLQPSVWKMIENDVTTLPEDQLTVRPLNPPLAYLHHRR